MTPPLSGRPALGLLRDFLASDDVPSAIRYLNSLTAHRFTGLYLFDAPTARNVFVVDKQNPSATRLPDVPMTATYCAFTRPGQGALVVADSLEDERFTEHPARREVRSYCGVPLVDAEGTLIGTICHFDFEVVSISDDNVELLEAVGPLLKIAPPN